MSERNKTNEALKYSGIGLKLMLTVLLGTALGLWLDGQLNTSPGFTVGLAVLSVFGGLYLMIKELIKK